VEGYIGNIATGLLAGINAARLLFGETLFQLPETTMIGALCQYICSASEQDFQPMKANFGLLPVSSDIKAIHNKRERGKAHCERALRTLDAYLTAREIAV
jgi:methylenetetrahydrofolate--tRNA-(uracil-5-)-methyltransferase